MKKSLKIFGVVIILLLIFNRYTIGFIWMIIDIHRGNHTTVDVYTEYSANSISLIEIKKKGEFFLESYDPDIEIKCTNTKTKQYTLITKTIDLGRLWDEMDIDIEWDSDEKNGTIYVTSDTLNITYDPVTFSCK